tara:strand:- start:529 stop:1431 length:903 start_codon:yes stop_codon:yes gene_type:complete
MSLYKEEDKLQDSIETYCKNTQKAYLYAYKKLKKVLDVDEIHKYENSGIIEKVKGAITNKNTINQAINIAIKLKRLYELDDDELVEYRDKELKGAISAETIAKNTRLSPLLPTYNEIDAWIDSLYEREEYRQYAVNYLLWNLNCRNLDLWVRFIRSPREAIGEHNYLVLTPHKVEFIRRRYKTYHAHGEKLNVITNKNFVKACWRLTNGFHRDPETHPYWLVLKHEDNEPSSEEQIGHHVSFQTFNKIGETNYLKIIMLHVDATGNLSRLNQISKNRGTHINVLLTNYNCKNKAFIDLVE